MKKVKVTKQHIKWAIEDLESKLNDSNTTQKEVKVIKACLRCHKYRLSKFKK